MKNVSLIVAVAALTAGNLAPLKADWIRPDNVNEEKWCVRRIAGEDQITYNGQPRTAYQFLRSHDLDYTLQVFNKPPCPSNYAVAADKHMGHVYCCTCTNLMNRDDTVGIQKEVVATPPPAPVSGLRMSARLPKLPHEPNPASTQSATQTVTYAKPLWALTGKSAQEIVELAGKSCPSGLTPTKTPNSNITCCPTLI